MFEALRPIDPRAAFHVSLLELDFRDVSGHEPTAFPAAELVASVDAWLEGLDPDCGEHHTEWSGGGVRLLIRAKGRGPSWRGWRDIPSFSLLEPEIGDLHIVGGSRRRLIDLTLGEVDQLASGQLRVVGQGQSYQETFSMLADEMRHFQWQSVADMPPPVIQAYAGMLGLMSGPPGQGNYESTWTALNRRRPNN